ncbi:MAG: glycosyl transferase [Archangium gephyra]|uniref:Glycosyl transferase n=1 Tax=Archangium gephyra TaxID=48 RepID=A0A2W5TC53_9BACT|nr:MAG: glycosyl transferase [Archangium gephyra]
MKTAVVIPVYNHEHAIGVVVEQVRTFGLPVVLVDDGSNAACAAVLETLAKQEGVSLYKRAQNGGKGAAVMSGLEEARRLGFTHAIQIDADGQHALKDLPKFLEAAQQNPEALVSGVPVYDASVPRARLYARYLTHIWVWINTLSFAIKDSMCGFRVYPLERTLAAIVPGIGKRMDFDPEIAVRLVWRGTKVINIPTPVTYPMDGVSHFDALWDNVRISGMHTRLFFGMLIRLPVLLWRKVKA